MRERIKRLLARIVRPGVAGIEARLRRIEEALEPIAGAALNQDKYREELAYWRWLIKSERGRASLHGPFAEVYGGWQRERLRELGRTLGLDGDEGLAGWCAEQSVVEIGGGPYPAVGAAAGWRRAVAVDPLAKGYVEEGLVPAACGRVTFLEAPGERVPLPASSADLVIIENALDHVGNPGAVVREIARLLRPGGLLWLLVDLSNYSDHMHPHPFNEQRVRTLVRDAGFEVVSDRVSDHKSHPKAYGEYRGLLRKAGGAAAAVEAKPESARV